MCTSHVFLYSYLNTNKYKCHSLGISNLTCIMNCLSFFLFTQFTQLAELFFNRVIFFLFLLQKYYLFLLSLPQNRYCIISACTIFYRGQVLTGFYLMLSATSLQYTLFKAYFVIINLLLHLLIGVFCIWL